MIIVVMFLIVIILTGTCIIRQREKCNSSSVDTTSNINITVHPSQDSGLDFVDKKDPWYELNKLSAAQSKIGTYSANTRHSRQPSDDSFYIPTIKGYFRE